MAVYRAIATQDALAEGLYPSIFLAQISKESGFNPNARSSAGAEGIAQFMPGTAAGYHINPMDPVAALAAAAKMDAQNLSKYHSYARMLSAYNSGRPDAYTDPNFAGGQTYRYVQSILKGRNPAARASAPTLTPPKSGGGYVAPSPITGPNPQQRAMLTALKLNGGDPMVIKLLSQGMARQSLGAAAPVSSPTIQRSTVADTHGVATGNSLVKTALTQIGNPYQWGGPAVLGKNTDCSGLIQATMAAHGINVGRTTYQQWQEGRPVNPKALKPGDAVFFHMGPQGPGHVGMYIGGGKFIEDPHTGSVVRISNLASYPGFAGARRFT